MAIQDLLLPAIGVSGAVALTVGGLATVFLRVLIQVKSVSAKIDRLDLATTEVHTLMNSRFDQLEDEIVILKGLNTSLREKLVMADDRATTREQYDFGKNPEEVR